MDAQGKTTEPHGPVDAGALKAEYSAQIAGNKPADFSAGCNARIAGLPIASCPHAEGDRRRYWREGWLDVHLGWGKWVLGRWAVTELPAVGAYAACGEG